MAIKKVVHLPMYNNTKSGAIIIDRLFLAKSKPYHPLSALCGQRPISATITGRDRHPFVDKAGTITFQMSFDVSWPMQDAILEI